jgi:hypothetical protein
MAVDPDDPRLRYEAEIAAIRFEGEEQDRWLQAHSFAYRHYGAFMAVSFLMIIGCLAGLLIGGYDPDATWRMWFYVALGYGGIIILLFTSVRPDTRNWLRALIRALVSLSLAMALIVLMYAGIGALAT